MTKSIFIFTILVVFVAIAVWFVIQKTREVNKAPEGLVILATATPTPSPASTPIQMENGLKIQDLKIGTGQEAKAGDTITVNYVGALENGTVFDASEKHGGPATFQIGVGQLIKGWDIGIPGMKIGGKRKLIVPPSLGYASQNVGNGLIPPNSTLVFEVELLAVQAPQK